MEISYKNCKGEKIVEINENNFYEEVGKLLMKEECQKQVVEVEVEGIGKVEYKLSLRSETIFITELYNDLPQNFIKPFGPKFLTCIDPEKNAYKYYKLEKVGDKVRASYGRMGTKKGELFGERSYDYDLSMFWIKYFEKIQKGYKDYSELYLDGERESCSKQNHDAITKPNSASERLFAKLNNFAKKAVEEAEVFVPITETILTTSKQLIDQLRKDESVDSFNKDLLELMSILQRPVRTGDGMGVREQLAIDESDFKRIILREADLLQAMEGYFYGNGLKTAVYDFKKYGVSVFIANEKQKRQVMSHLSETLQKKVKEVYRVIPKEQQKRFNDYLEKNDIHRVKQLWHGSRNQNWMSIMVNSLQLNPDAIITGKMFGSGIYFAPSSMKSWNYTSYMGASWSKGTSSTAFMGLYAVAYGRPKDVDQWNGHTDYKQLVKDNHCNCLHAHAEKGFLRNDEIVFYDEAAMVMNYIVEFE